MENEKENKQFFFGAGQCCKMLCEASRHLAPCSGFGGRAQEQEDKSQASTKKSSQSKAFYRRTEQ